jgi:hypothetical protein
MHRADGAPWYPPQARMLFRYRRSGSEERHHSLSREAPRGFELEHVLGAVHASAPPGTTKLYATTQGSFLTTAQPDVAALIAPDDRYLGSLELVGFVGLDGLLLGISYATGQHVLVAGRDDPLLSGVAVQAELGWVEPVPLRPRHVSATVSTYGLVGLCRSLDLAERRHRYAVGRMPAGEPVGELGALHTDPGEGSVPLWLTPDDRVAIGDGHAHADAPDLSDVLHWIAAPAAWRGFGQHSARARSVMRRARDARNVVGKTARAAAVTAGPPAGYGHFGPGPGRVPLYAARHPATGDQLLTSYPLEAQDMGYVDLALLAWINDAAPVTGATGIRRVGVPWASRYGLEARWA